MSVHEAALADDGDAVAARVAMVNALTADGSLADPAWRDVFGLVPRHALVPAFFESSAQLGARLGLWRHVTASGGRAGWLRSVYRDVELVTQLDGFRDANAARREDGVPGVATCSGTAPGVLARLFAALEVEDRHHALLVGTGTGYSTALLSRRLEPWRVTAIDYETILTARARAALEPLGLRPVLVSGDAGVGRVGRDAAYDRLLATCAFPALPGRWLPAMTPGGVIVMPWRRPLGGGLLLRLRVEDETRAVGRLLPWAADVPPSRGLVTPSTVALWETATDHLKNDRYAPSSWRVTAMDPRDLDTDGFRALAALLVPARLLDNRQPDGSGGLWLLADDGSYACLMLNEAGAMMVIEHGPCQLWGMLEDAFATWMSLGQPAREDFGITVTPNDHVLWHGSPKNWSRPLDLGPAWR